MEVLHILIIFCAVHTVTSQSCDLERARVCVTQMEDLITGVLETTAGLVRTDRLQQLCLDVIKGNNLTQCFIDATTGCVRKAPLAPSDVTLQWEKVMQDLYALCDGACPNFLERTVNITQCTGMIRFDALYNYSYQTFCRSLNESLQCVSETSATCPQFSNLFFDLLPDGLNATVSTLCTGGCQNFETTLALLDTCKKFVADLPDTLHNACESYASFKTCLKMTELPTSCPMFGSLVSVLYPQHIYGQYENCNSSSGQIQENSEDWCGAQGIDRIDHCIHIFSLAWPANPKEMNPSQHQCKNYMRGVTCLEKAGFSQCSNLRQHYQNQTHDRQAQSQMLRDQCAKMFYNSGQGSIHGWTLATAVFTLMIILHIVKL